MDEPRLLMARTCKVRAIEASESDDRRASETSYGRIGIESWGCSSYGRPIRPEPASRNPSPTSSWIIQTTNGPDRVLAIVRVAPAEDAPERDSGSRTPRRSPASCQPSESKDRARISLVCRCRDHRRRRRTRLPEKFKLRVRVRALALPVASRRSFHDGRTQPGLDHGHHCAVRNTARHALHEWAVWDRVMTMGVFHTFWTYGWRGVAAAVLAPMVDGGHVRPCVCRSQALTVTRLAQR
jgi:hypothetical protein